MYSRAKRNGTLPLLKISFCDSSKILIWGGEIFTWAIWPQKGGRCKISTLQTPFMAWAGWIRPCKFRCNIWYCASKKRRRIFLPQFQFTADWSYWKIFCVNFWMTKIILSLAPSTRYLVVYLSLSRPCKNDFHTSRLGKLHQNPWCPFVVGDEGGETLKEFLVQKRKQRRTEWDETA